MASHADIDDLLRGYVAPSDGQIARWWKTADVAVDANVLLNLYRYSADTREQLLGVLRALDERLWIPRRAGEEFARNRLRVLVGQRNAQAKIEGLFTRLIEETGKDLLKISDELSRRQGAPLHHERATEVLEQLRDTLLEEERERFGPASDLSRDLLLADVRELLKERMGPGLTDEQMAVVRRRGPDRYKQKVPPGFEDADKGGDDQFGDLILWREILERSKATRRPVILVTDDAKEDWVYRLGGKRIGPHPLLVRELWDVAGVNLLVYDTARFVSQANRRIQLAEQVSDAALAEVRATPTFWATQTNETLPRNTVLGSRPYPGLASGGTSYVGTGLNPGYAWTGTNYALPRAPAGIASITGGTAILALMNPPANATVICTVTAPDGSITSTERRTDADLGPCSLTYPHDFEGAATGPGTYRFRWFGDVVGDGVYVAGGEAVYLLLFEGTFALHPPSR